MAWRGDAVSAAHRNVHRPWFIYLDIVHWCRRGMRVEALIYIGRFIRVIIINATETDPIIHEGGNERS